MRHWLLAGTMMLGLTAAAAPAFAQSASPSGYAGGGYGRTSADVEIDGVDFGDDEGDSWRVDGAIVFPLGSTAGLQVDGEYLRLQGDGDDADVLSGTAHLFNAGERGAYGVFAGVSDADDLTFWSVGGEAQANFDRTTFAAQFGYGRIDELDEADFFAGRGEARFFATDNLRFDVNGGITRIDGDGGEVDFVNYGAGVEYKFDANPLSLFANVDRVEFDESGVDLTSNTLFVGVRYNFGGGTLKDRDRSGARFAPASRLFGGGLGTAAIGALGDEDFDVGT
jgi:hypothetical protein